MLTLAGLVIGSLRLMLIIKVFGFCASVWVIARRGAFRDLRDFLRAYWSRRYLRDSIANLAVWSATIGAYFYAYVRLDGRRGHALERTLDREPLLTITILVVLAWLLLSTAKQTAAQVRKAVLICDGLSFIALVKKIQAWVLVPTLLGASLGGLPFFISLPSAFVPNLFLERHAKNQLRAGVEQFLLDGIVEYVCRLLLVVGSVYVESGTLRLW